MRVFVTLFSFISEAGGRNTDSTQTDLSAVGIPRAEKGMRPVKLQHPAVPDGDWKPVP